MLLAHPPGPLSEAGEQFLKSSRYPSGGFPRGLCCHLLEQPGNVSPPVVLAHFLLSFTLGDTVNYTLILFMVFL